MGGSGIQAAAAALHGPSAGGGRWEARQTLYTVYHGIGAYMNWRVEGGSREVG